MLDTGFETLAERHRQELHVHCYRMLGSFDEAEDAVQETLLRAWRGRSQFDGGSGLRAWLYKIATNCCLDALRRRGRQPPRAGSHGELPWLQPYPDRLLDELPSDAAGPDAVVVARETIELAFIAIIQRLPPRQRAALLLCDVLGWPPREIASLLDTSLGAANSALQRARSTLAAERPEPAGPPELDPREQELLEVFIDIHEGHNPERAAALLSEDVRVTMPPHPWCFEGREAVLGLMRDGTGPKRPGDWRLVTTRANRQPAAACYLRGWEETEFRAFKFDVLEIRDGRIAEITTFGNALFSAFGLPGTLQP